MQSYDRTTRGRSAGFLMLAVAAIGLAGCGSLDNPYLRFDSQPSVASKQSNGTVLVRPIDIGDALTYADKVKNRYREVIGEDARFNRLLGAGLIGTATALPIMALNEARTKSLGIVGVYGAGAYALDAWLQSGPRQRAYIQGYSAVNCAIAVVLPLAFDQAQEPYMSFNTAVNDIISKMGDLEEAIGHAKIEIETPGGLTEAEKELGRQMVASARTAIAEAKEARRRGIEVRIRIAAAGGRLTSTVDRIIGEVDAAIQANASDFSTLSGIIGGLGRIYGEFPGAPAISVFGPNGSQSGIEASRAPALTELATRTAAVASGTLVISDFVSALALAQPSRR